MANFHHTVHVRPIASTQNFLRQKKHTLTRRCLQFPQPLRDFRCCCRFLTGLPLESKLGAIGFSPTVKTENVPESIIFLGQSLTSYSERGLDEALYM